MNNKESTFSFFPCPLLSPTLYKRKAIIMQQNQYNK